MFRFRFEALIITVLILGACRSEMPEAPDFGLPRLELKVDSRDFGELESTVAAKNEVPAKIIQGDAQFAITLSYSGKSSLYFRKRSFQVVVDQGSIWGVSSFRLSAQSADPSFLRTQLAFKVFEESGFVVPKTRPVALYMNGNYVGLYLWIEDVDETFFDRRELPTISIYKARYGRLGYADLGFDTLPYLNVGFKVVQGGKDLGDLQEQIYRLAQPLEEMSDEKALDDLDPLIRYQAIAAALNHWDGFKNNFILYRLEGQRSFSWMPWDGDQIFSDREGFRMFNSSNSLWGDARAAEWIRSHPALCKRYLDILTEILGKSADPGRLQAWLDIETNRVARAYAADPNYSRYDQRERKAALEGAMKEWNEAMRHALEVARRELSIQN